MAVPTPAELETALAKSSQLWIISGDHQLLTDAHVKVIKKFFRRGPRRLHLGRQRARTTPTRTSSLEHCLERR